MAKDTWVEKIKKIKVVLREVYSKKIKLTDEIGENRRNGAWKKEQIVKKTTIIKFEDLEKSIKIDYFK